MKLLICNACGLKDILDDDEQRTTCCNCGGAGAIEERGMTRREDGYGQALAPFPIHFSHIHGKKLYSWSDYHQANREAGLVDSGRPSPMPTHNRKTAVSYPGQSVRTSTAERR